MLRFYNCLRTIMVPALFSLLLGCAVEHDATEQAEDFATLSLQCQSLPAKDHDTLFAVYALIAESKIKIGELVTCDTILPEAYAQYNIPAQALTAVGGQAEAQGGYIYVDRDSNSLRFFQGYVADPAQGVQWQQLAVYRDGAIRAVFD